MKRTKPLIYGAVFVAGILVSNLWHSVNWAFWRPIQYLRDSNRLHKAVLERNEWIDLNFRIILDGKRIYQSPDFRPSPSFPLRETLVWDDTGKILIFEVLGRRLFGYDTMKNRQLSNNEVLSAKVADLPIERYGFEGEWPVKQN